MIVYLMRDIPAFVMYCVNGASRSSLLIESVDYDKQNKFQDYELKNYKNYICNAKVHEVLLISA